MEKIRKRWTILMTAACLAAALMLAGCGKDFDAEGYVQGILDQVFQGDVKQAAQILEETTEKELEEQYEEMLAGFVDNNIISGMQVSDAMRQDYIEVCRQIFMAMRYDVGEAKKISRTEYEVPVEYAPVDIFVRFVEGVKEDSEEIMQKAKNGEYKGTEEEINAQMQSEFLRHSNELLHTYAGEMKYGEEKTFIFHVKADKKKQFSIPDEELEDLKVKILRLDEIQG